MISNSMRFDHLGVVVSDLNLGRHHFSEIYGINSWTDAFVDELNGVYAQFGRSKDKFCYELVAPIDENSPISNVLSKKINILNHIAYIVDVIDACSDKLLNNNFIPLGEPKNAVAYNMKKVQFFYSKEFDYILEIIEAPDFCHKYFSTKDAFI